MSPVLLKMFMLIVPHMGHWTDHQMLDFCEQVDPYIKHIANNEFSERDEAELLEFLNMVIRIEESE